MKKGLNFKRAQAVKFSVIYHDGTQEQKFHRYCKRPFATKEYKKLIKGLDQGHFKAVVTGPAI